MDATPEGTRQDGQNLQDKHWGDSTATKGHSILRIAALNVGCLQSESNHWKNRDMWQWIKQMKIDVTLLSEIGINWSKMGGTTSWSTAAKQHVHTERHALSYNEHEQYGSRRQWGGTACTTTGLSSGRVMAQETDPKRLGRWASLTMRGKKGTTVRMVSVYVPSKGGKSAGTVYNQQASWLESQGNTTPPIKQLIQDLEEALQEWRSAGETIVIGGDINMQVDRSQMAEMMKRQGMREAILSRHPNAPGISTNIRAQSDRVIDGLWVSKSLSIIRAGYSAFGPWDHRTAWVEVTSESIFGTQSKPTPTFSGRRVQLNRPNTVSRYQEQLRKQYQAKQIGLRVQRLRQATVAGERLTEEQIAEAESIDADRTHMMLNAEKRARRIFLGNVPFSPEIKRKAMEKQFWDLAWKKRQGKTVSSRWYNRAKKKANLSIRTATLSTEEIQERHKRAHQLWKNAKRNAAEYRKTFLEERAEEVARAGKTTVAAALSNIVQREEVVQTFQAIRRVTGSYDANGKVALVIATNENGEEEVYDTEQAVIKQCMKANEAKYRQAYITPLQARRFEQDVQQHGATRARQQHQHQLGLYDNMLMDQLLSGHPVPWPAEFQRITVESHQALWSKARERTTSGPSGLHFGLWKANAKDDQLAEVDAAMREISLRTGYNLQRWLRCEDVTLLKEPGNYRVTRFRTISLVEGDFNANLKWVGKIMMQHAEQHDMLPEEQYGSRKQRSAAEVSLNNRMIDDIVRITGATSAICSNDAKSCYDRMAHNPLRMSMSRIGVPPWISHSVTDAVEGMKHHVLTSFGRSLRTYPTKGTKLQGLLQGLGISPAGWVAMSSPLMQAMQRQGYGFRTTSPISRTTTRLVCFSFVDDTDLIHSVRNDASDPNACIAEVQAVVDSWEGMLRATGGALEPRKSYWYLMAFSWDGERWRYKTVEEQPGEISIRQPDSNDKSQLQRLHVDQARKALGVMVRHDGNQESNEAYYVGKAQQWADKMRRGKLLRMHAWIAMKATIWKTIEYPLLSSTFSKAAAERIMRPILQAALPASGIQRNVSRALVFGAPQGFGLGVPHLYNVQTVRHIEAIVRHWKTPSLTGRLLRTQVEILTLQVGIPRVMEMDFDKWGLLAEESWMKSVWGEAHEAAIQIRYETPIVTPPRQHDVPVMDLVMKLGLPKSTLRAVNLCRQKKQVFWLSDIVNATGDALVPNVLEPEPTQLRQSVMKWPAMGAVSSARWRQWRQVISQCFSASRTRAIKLERPLGSWREFSSMRPLVFRNVREDRLFHSLLPDQHFRRIPRRRRQRQYETAEGAISPGQEVVDGYQSQGRIMVIDSGPGLPPDTPPVTQLDTLINAMPPSKSWAVYVHDMVGEVDTVAHSLRCGTLKACSDGSVADGCGAAGAVIHASHQGEETRLWLANRTPATNEIMQSHRAELAGIYGVLVLVEVICEACNVTQGSMTLGCDNLSALKAIDGEWHLSPRSTDADLQRAVRSLSQGLPIAVTGKHVKGHQDDAAEWTTLDDWAKLNIEADKLAGSARVSLPEACVYAGAIYGERVSIHSRCKLTTIRYDSIFGRSTAGAAIEVLTARKVVDQGEPVHWSAVAGGLRSLDHTKRILTFKLVTGEAATGQRMKQWGLRDSDKCPNCGEPESSAHFWECKDPVRVQAASRHVKDIRSWMQRYPTSPGVTQAIISALRSQISGTVLLQPTDMSAGMRSATQSQAAVGRMALRKGFLSAEWHALQEAFLKQQETRKTAKKWSIQLVRRIWKIAWEQWQVRNDALFHQDDSADAEMEQALRTRVASIRQRLEESPTSHHRIIDTTPGEGASVPQIAVWLEQAARLLGEPAAHGTLSRWLRYKQQVQPSQPNV